MEKKKTFTRTEFITTIIIVLHLAGALGLYIGYKYKGIRHPYVNQYNMNDKFKVLRSRTAHVRSFMDSTQYAYTHFSNTNFKKDSTQLIQLLIPLKKSLDEIKLQEGKKFTVLEHITYGEGSREYWRKYIFIKSLDDPI